MVTSENKENPALLEEKSFEAQKKRTSQLWDFWTKYVGWNSEIVLYLNSIICASEWCLKYTWTNWMSRHRDLVCLPSRTIQNDDDLYQSSDDLVQGRMKLTLWRDSVRKGEKDWEKEKRKIERQLLFQDLNVFFPCFLHWFLTIFGIMWIWRDLKNHACGVHHPWPPIIAASSYHCFFLKVPRSQATRHQRSSAAGCVATFINSNKIRPFRHTKKDDEIQALIFQPRVWEPFCPY